MSSDGDAIVEMAETLTVIAGDNAWAAARAFGSASAQEGKAAEARRWRDVARAILRKRASAFASTAELAIAPAVPDFAVPYEPRACETSAIMEPVKIAVAAEPVISSSVAAAIVVPVNGEAAPSAPIPLRARRAVAPANIEPGKAEIAQAA